MRDILWICQKWWVLPDKPRRYTIGEVELGINYVLISTNAGLWGNIGDTVQFTIKTVSDYRFRKN
jgi:hypothetical protein